MRLAPGASLAVLAAAACFGVAGTAAAQPERPLTAYYVAPIGQSILPDTVPLNSSERTFSEGEIVLRGRIAYRAAAVVAEPIELSIAGQHFPVRPGEMLNEVQMRGGAMTGLRGARIFCLASHRPQEAEDRRFDPLVYPCLVDRDGDGGLDFAVLVGTRRAEDRVPVSLASLPYRVEADLPIPGAELRLTFQTHLTLTPPSLQLGILLPGFSYDYVRIRVKGPDGRMRDIRLDDNVTSRTYPHVISFGPARFEILGYDPMARQVRLRILEGFTRSDLEVVLVGSGRR